VIRLSPRLNKRECEYLGLFHEKNAVYLKIGNSLFSDRIDGIGMIFFESRSGPSKVF
jgi:hypothetical protein